jgi:hypothetical protein
MLRNLLAVAVMVAFAGSLAAQPDPKKPDPKTLVTKVYDLKPLLGEKGKAGGLGETDAVLKVIFETIPALRELKPGADGPQLVERDNGKLEVRATAATHQELKDLIEALTRINDLKIDVQAVVYEFDTATFDKLAKALPRVGRGRPGAAILFASGEEFDKEEVVKEAEKALAGMNKILKAARQVQKSEGRFPNGAESTLSVRQSVVAFQAHEGMEGEPPQFVKEGFRLSGVLVASADRRFVRMSLTEKSAFRTGIRKRELGEEMGVKIVAQSPELEDAGGSSSAVVADGGTAIFRLAYAPKDKVWVVVLQPRIYIQAEQDEIKRQQEKKEKK